MNSKTALRIAPHEKVTLHRQFADVVAGKRVYPIGIECSPSGVCQASCGGVDDAGKSWGCWYARGDVGNHRNVFLDKDRILSLFGEMVDLEIGAITWTGGGEPTLHRDFPNLVSAATACGLKQGLFTNALATPRYDPQALEWIRVTMTDKPYNRENIKRLRGCKTLGFAFNYRGSEDDAYLMETLHLADDVGADYVQLRPSLKFHGQTVDVTPPKIDHPLLFVTEEKFVEARKKHSYTRCEAFKMVPFLWEDGNLDVCSYNRPSPGYTLGNVYKDSLKVILDKAPDSVAVHEGCQVACKLNTMNNAIHHARTIEDPVFP